MKGDYVKVLVRVNNSAGGAEHMVQAMKDGASVAVKMPDRGESFITVTEYNKVNVPVRTARFLATEVLAITEGHDQLQRPKKR